MRGLMLVLLLAAASSAAAAPLKKQVLGGIAYTSPPIASCACSDGAMCRGKRGGRYCIAPNGRKRYR